MDTTSAISKPIPWNATQEQMDNAVEETIQVIKRKQDLEQELRLAYHAAANRYREKLIRSWNAK